MSNNKRNTSKIVSAIVAVLALFLFNQYEAGSFPFSGGNSSGSNSTKVESGNHQSGNQQSGIPEKVYNVLDYVQDKGKAKSGYVGGRTFGNREQLLPKKDDSGKRITYQEWDVNPKVKGKNRGTERIVTGSDGRSWYTNDHYNSFKEIK